MLFYEKGIYQRGRWMIEVTAIAEKKIKQQLDQRGHGLGIRVGVKTTGCNGYAYTLEFVDEKEDHDNVFEKDGYSVFVDDKALLFLDGVTMDYIKNGLNEGFDYINPREKSRCGCGESFEL